MDPYIIVLFLNILLSLAIYTFSYNTIMFLIGLLIILYEKTIFKADYIWIYFDQIILKSFDCLSSDPTNHSKL